MSMHLRAGCGLFLALCLLSSQPAGSVEVPIGCSDPINDGYTCADCQEIVGSGGHYTKCGDPGTADRCDTQVYDSVVKMCYLGNPNCPGPRYVYATSSECWGDFEPI